MLKYYREHYGLEIPAETEIGRGLYIGHAFNITINPNAIIGGKQPILTYCIKK